MKKTLLSIVIIIFFFAAKAQNVGIGETSPASKFSVKGNVSIGSGYSSTAAPSNGAIIEGTVGIGTSAPNASAIVDISATNKGVRFPNVDLQSQSDATTIASPAKGLIVWNTAATWGTQGLYINTGTTGIPLWDKVSTAAGTVTAVTASSPLSATSGNSPNISLTGVVPIANGGTNSGTALSGSSIVVSNGSAIVQGAAGTTTTVLHGNPAGIPSYSAVALGADVSGTLPVGNGGTGANLATTGGTGQYVKQSTLGGALTVGTIAAADLPGTFSGFANPSTTIALSAVNGTATTAMRSDAAPALSQAITPTWTGLHVFTNGITSTGAAAVSIGTDATNNTISLGTGGAVKTVSLGSTNTTSTTTINSGSGAVNINTNNNQPTNVNTGTSTGTVTIGNASNNINLPKMSASAVLLTDASKNITSATILGVGNGGTGSSTQNWVDLTTNQTAAGVKTWSNQGSFSAGLTTAAQMVSTQANSTTTGGGQIYLNGATGNRIDFNTNGVAVPSLTTRSVGTKVVLFPQLSATEVDYAVGIAANTQWYSVPGNTNAYQHAFYGGTSELMRIRGDGNVGIGNTAPSEKLHVTGNIYAEGKFIVQNTTDGGPNRGIWMWSASDANWGIYMGQAGANKTIANTTAPSGGFSSSNGTAQAGVFSTHAIRTRVANSSAQGIIFENGSDQTLFSVRGSDGFAALRGGMVLGGGGFVNAVPNSCGGNWVASADFALMSLDKTGCGDEAYIAHYNRSGESSTLEIGNKNDNDDHIALMPSGNVGINTTNPTQARLVVIGVSSLGNQSVGTFWYHATGFSGCIACNVPNSGSASGNINIGVYTDNRMVATEFDATSDRRIKKDFKPSISASDLVTLTALKVTDFKYVDDFSYGSDYKKGFVAQEVEEVFPEAVQKHTDFIPSIYQLSKTTSYDARSREFTIVLNKTHNVTIGEKVKIGTSEKDNIVCTVVDVISPTTFKVKDWTQGEQSSVFVYGKEVNDFRTVDYDRIYTLNVSATQELFKQLQVLRSENEHLKEQNELLLKSKADFSDLEKLRVEFNHLKQLTKGNGLSAEK